MRAQRRVERPGSPIIHLSTCENVEFPCSPGESRNLRYSAMPRSRYSCLSNMQVKNNRGFPQQPGVSVNNFPLLLSARQMRSLNSDPSFRRLDGKITRFSHGWYAYRKMTDALILKSLWQVLPSDAALAGETAALIHGVRVRESSRLGTEYRLCVTRPTGKRALRRPGLHCRIGEVIDGDIIWFNGMKVTSPVRTAVDLACSMPLDVATHVIELFLGKGLVTREMLWKRAAKMSGRRGVRTLREAIRSADERSESPLETAVRLRLSEAGLPDSTPQVPVKVAGFTNPRRIDLGFVNAEPQPVGIEVQSVTYHPLTGPKRLADVRRLDAIESAGWKMIEVFTHQLAGRDPNFEVEVAAALGANTPVHIRKDWRVSRWEKRRSRWRRDPHELWPAFRSGVGNLA